MLHIKTAIPPKPVVEPLVCVCVCMRMRVRVCVRRRVVHAYVRILPQVCAVGCCRCAVLCVVVVGCVHVGLCSCVIRAFCVIRCCVG